MTIRAHQPFLFLSATTSITSQALPPWILINPLSICTIDLTSQSDLSIGFRIMPPRICLPALPWHRLTLAPFLWKVTFPSLNKMDSCQSIIYPYRDLATQPDQ